MLTMQQHVLYWLCYGFSAIKTIDILSTMQHINTIPVSNIYNLKATCIHAYIAKYCYSKVLDLRTVHMYIYIPDIIQILRNITMTIWHPVYRWAWDVLSIERAVCLPSLIIILTMHLLIRCMVHILPLLHVQKSESKMLQQLYSWQWPQHTSFILPTPKLL